MLVKIPKEEREEAKRIAKREKQIATQQAMIKRQQDKQMAKQNDPEWREERLNKAREQARKGQRQRLSKQRTTYKESQGKADNNRRKRIAKSGGSLSGVVKVSKKSKGYGLKGRPPTAEEKRAMDKIGALPCICCTVLKERGLISAVIESSSQHNEVTLHHIDGRTKENAHFKVLPLCKYHHDIPIDKSHQQHPEYKYLVPIHVKNAWGGKATFNALFGSEYALLHCVYERAGLLSKLEPLLS